MEISTIGLDLAKGVFQMQGADASGRAVLRRKLQRAAVSAFLRRGAVAMRGRHRGVRHGAS